MTEIKPHPIALSELMFTRSIVVAVPEHVADMKAITEGPTNSISVSPIEDKRGHFNARMHTVMNASGDKKYPYVIDMECIAEFIADDTLTEEDAKRGVYITAHSVLYGAIREAVSWITARQPLLFGLSVIRPAAPVESDEPSTP